MKNARDPRFQALFAVRGVSANVFKKDISQLIGANGNREFTNLVTVMGCNVKPKFDMNKLQFNKIIIASDADIDGLFIRSLLMAFFFKLFPEIIIDGRLFIAEPPLYRVDDKKNPFIINKEDYVRRYVISASKSYMLGYAPKDHPDEVVWMSKQEWAEFLSSTSSYVDDIQLLSEHYKVNDRLIEMIIEEFAMYYTNAVNNSSINSTDDMINIANIERCKKNIQLLMDRIGTEFPELYYDDSRDLIMGSVDAKLQLIELSEPFIRRCTPLIKTIARWGSSISSTMILRDVKTHTEQQLSLLGVLKILKKFQPNILHRFKGLGENDDADIKTTIMDPNTRTLIQVKITDIENDMKVFQMLRGNSAQDALDRKMMMKAFKIPKDQVDT